MTSLELTSCQDKALDELTGWLLSDDKYYVLSGAAGTGKSFLLNQLVTKIPEINDIRGLLESDAISLPMYTATTNKAAGIVGGRTINSALGLSVFEDWKTGKVKINDKKALPIHGEFIVIDEASMVSDELKEYIDKLTPNCKVLYVGDIYQLHPVGLDYSPVFDAGYDMSELLTPCRQDPNSQLYAVCQSLREMVKSGAQPTIAAGPDIEFIDDNGLNQYIQKMDNEDRIIGFTNNTCISMNKHVSQMKGFNSGFLEEGQLVTLNKAIQIGSKFLSTDSQFTVTDVGPAEYDHAYGINFHWVTLDYTYTVKVPANIPSFLEEVEAYRAAKQWGLYFKLTNEFADLREGYVITGHKSQGSSYDNVVINLANFNKCKDKAMLPRLLYVAFSRAKKKVFLYGSVKL